MTINYSKKFIKQLSKLPTSIQLKFEKKLKLFINNKFTNQLNNHKLKGKLSHCRSINITGDHRAIYEEQKNGKIIFFLMIGTHSEIYK